MHERIKISNCLRNCYEEYFFLQNSFVLFGSLKIKNIVIPSIKFSLNYQQNFIYAFFKKITVKYLFEEKTIRKKKFSKII